MVSKTLFLLALGMTASAFTIPTDQPDGVYTFQHSDGGNGNHTKVGEIPALSRLRARGSAVAARSFPSDQTGCNDGSVTSLDYLSATNALSQTCQSNPIYSANTHAYAVSGGAVAYMCNYGGDNPCVSGELQSALAEITPLCTNGRAGWAWSWSWKKSYGYDSVMASICNGES